MTDPAADSARKPRPVLVCLRCFNGIPADWVRPFPLETTATTITQRNGAIGIAFCWVCYSRVRVGEADYA
jgi:hypothetical protein